MATITTGRTMSPGKRVPWMSLEPGIVHADHTVLTLEPAGDRERVVALAEHAQLQGLEAAEQEPAVEG